MRGCAPSGRGQAAYKQLWREIVVAKIKFEAYLRRIETNLPNRGDVHILTFTDKQYENIVRFSGQRRKRQKKNPDQLALF
jgi:CRISPR/Cas system-associated protein endoribonuclease Cas2